MTHLVQSECQVVSGISEDLAMEVPLADYIEFAISFEQQRVVRGRIDLDAQDVFESIEGVPRHAVNLRCATE